MSKTQRVVDLVKEISELEALRDSKLADLQALIGDKSGSKAKAKAKAGAQDDTWPKLIVRHLSSNRGRAVGSAELCKAIGCPPHVLTYHMKPLVQQKRVKRVKRGYYQLRGGR